MALNEPFAAPDTAALDAFREDRTYLGADHVRNERRTWIVTAICMLTLVGLLVGGGVTGSIALTASGLHMGAHVVSLLVASAAYALARRHAGNPAFSFGTGKLGYLAGFTNALVLVATAGLIAMESGHRLLGHGDGHVHFGGALPIAAGGLAINLVCILLLRPSGATAGRNDPEGDLNLSAAHLHLSADAVVSVITLAALLAGHELGWEMADPVAGLLAAALVGHFSWRLLRRTGAALLDINPSQDLTAEVRRRLTSGGETLVDLHLWRLGPGHHAVIAVIAADHPTTAQAYRDRLAGLGGLSHVTVEVRGRMDGAHDHAGHNHT
jgi:cation diffusion facilitator family transporter